MNRQRGQATVEFVLVLPVVFLALLLVVQAGVVVRDELLVVEAAREAARAASVDPDPAAAIAAATRVLPGARVAVGPRGEIGDPVRVTVTYVARTAVPGIGPFVPDPTLRAEAVMRIEG